LEHNNIVRVQIADDFIYHLAPLLVS
jgi:hypothetical protein